MINLKSIIDQIKEDKEIDNLSLPEQLDIQTYYYLAEVMDLTDVYPFNVSDKFYAEFTDNNKITHFTRILYQPLKTPRYDFKFGFFDENGKASYDRPNLHYNLGPDEKIFNTHLHLLIKKFLEEDRFFEKIPESHLKRLYLPAMDYSRYRLFRMALNKLLDKTKYKFYDDPEHKNTLIIEPVVTNV